MTSPVRDTKRSPLAEQLRARQREKTTDEKLIELSEKASLKEVPLDQRRKEAHKPLFLTRYE